MRFRNGRAVKTLEGNCYWRTQFQAIVHRLPARVNPVDSLRRSTIRNTERSQEGTRLTSVIVNVDSWRGPVVEARMGPRLWGAQMRIRGSGARTL
jgi:hypothetical protein